MAGLSLGCMLKKAKRLGDKLRDAPCDDSDGGNGDGEEKNIHGRSLENISLASAEADRLCRLATVMRFTLAARVTVNPSFTFLSFSGIFGRDMRVFLSGFYFCAISFSFICTKKRAVFGTLSCWLTDVLQVLPGFSPANRNDIINAH